MDKIVLVNELLSLKEELLELEGVVVDNLVAKIDHTIHLAWFAVDEEWENEHFCDCECCWSYDPGTIDEPGEH